MSSDTYDTRQTGSYLEKFLLGTLVRWITDMFCPKCRSLMFPRNGELVCGNASCGFERSITEDDNDVSSISSPDKARPMETLVLDEVAQTLPRTAVECPKCGHHEAFWIMRQTRAADEPTTRIYRCAKCGNTWREY